MAKCPLCKARKGKRTCIAHHGLVCSTCCGEVRQEALCLACPFYQQPKRKYSDLDRYSTAEMDDNLDLQACANTIEGTICTYDHELGGTLSDQNAIRIIELLLDRHHFGVEGIDTTDPIVLEGYHRVTEAIREDHPDIDGKILVKILGVIHFVAKRRTDRGREYMDVIHQYTGMRVGQGARLMTLPGNK